MLGQLSLTALAALSVVNGSPVVQKRQVTSAIESAASSAASSVAASATSLASEATSAVSGASSTAIESATSASSAASSSVASASSAAATATGNATGTETFPLFPCPPGYLLTYVTQNATVPLPITNVTPALGEWASSPIFPNVTDPVGGSEPGATHTINIAGLPINEVLVNATSNSTSGYASFVWNLTNGPIQAPGVSISNWTAQLNVYDPDFATTGEIGNSTVADAFVNFCASDQAAGAGLLNSVLQLYLGNAAAALSGNATEAPASTTALESAATSATESASSAATSAATSAESSASSAASSAASGASSAASSAASGASSAASAATGAVESATSAAAAAASSAVAPAASTTA